MLVAAALIAAATALSGCSLLPFGQQAATPTAPVATPAAKPATASAGATGSASTLTSTTVEGTAAAAVNASMTAVPLSGQVEVPDVVGLDAKAAEKALKDARLDFMLTWSGDSMAKTRRVVSQSPEPGSTVASGTRVAILASTGKGEGRPFPVWYFQTVSDHEWGARGSGTTTMQKIFLTRDRWLLTTTLRTPCEIYLLDDAGHRFLIHRTFQEHGEWRYFMRPVKSTKGQWVRLQLVTSSSLWWEIRYGLFGDRDVAALIAFKRLPASPGNDVPSAPQQ